MKATELRIGNWLNHNIENKPYAITTISRHPEHEDCYMVLFGYMPHCTLEFMSPIPLTEEWLVKFGFSGITEDSRYFIKCGRKEIAMECTQEDKYEYLLYRRDVGIPFYGIGFIQYVHTLQNLYFALTGEELTIK